MRFQDAAPDARAIVYAGIQADPLVARMAEAVASMRDDLLWLARAVMNGERTEADVWRRMFPSLFAAEANVSVAAEAVLQTALEIANRGEAARSQYRGAFVETLTEMALAARIPGNPVRRERRVLFDGVRAEIHPYDVTGESIDRPEVYDCKWGARGINADVLNQLDDAWSHAADEEVDLKVGLVVFDARRSCEIRLARSTARHGHTRLVAMEDLDELVNRE